jgi:hypothetical protein
VSVATSSIDAVPAFDGKWVISSDEERWFWPEEGEYFETKELAQEAARLDGVGFVGRARCLTADRLFSTFTIEGFLESVDEGAIDNWGNHDAEQVLSWGKDDLEAILSAVLSVVRERGIVESWFTVDDVEAVGGAS